LSSCTSCGAALTESARFCAACGEAVSSGSQLPTNVVSPSIVVAVVVRCGILAAVVAESFCRLFGYRIYSSDPSHWAFYTAVIAVAIAAAIAWWGTRTALAGRSLLGEAAGEKG
jgi:protein-S-isoprenylcysteine O-methyltransferase Ste14